FPYRKQQSNNMENKDMPSPSTPLFRRDISVNQRLTLHGVKRFASFRRWVLFFLAPVLILIAMTPVQAQLKPDPSILNSVNWDQLQWFEDGRPANPGSSYAVLSGDLSTGPWVVINKVLAGNFNQPHVHLHDRYHIYVIKGTWWVGAGARLDPNISVPIPAGSYVQHLTNHLHWDGAKNEDVLLLIYGKGPFHPQSQDRLADHD